jgi:hypothetical protein
MMRLNTPLTQIDSVQAYTFGSRVQDKDCNEYIYLKGVASTIVGSWVTFDELGVTTLLVANAKGPVAVAMAITDSTSEYGWYQIWGTAEACIAANSADNTQIGFKTTSGYAGDGKATGDEIVGAIEREATGGAAAVVTVQLYYPLVNDTTGA